MPNQSLCRIDVGRQPYFLQTTLKDGGFELVITDTINSWEGKSKFSFMFLFVFLGPFFP